MRLRLAIAGLLAIGSPIFGQSFEVASVKPSAGETNISFTNAGGALTANGITVKLLMILAYGVRADQIEGGPDWVSTARYDVHAKAEGSVNKIPAEQLNAMIRSLLEDRFQLKVHRNTDRGSMYALVVGKGGPKFQESTAPSRGQSQRWSPQQVQVKFSKITMDALAARLSSIAGRPVTNKTSLGGEYDITLEYAPLTAPPDSPHPSIFTAVQEQLGLHLEGQKGDVETLVIDRIARPSEN